MNGIIGLHGIFEWVSRPKVQFFVKFNIPNYYPERNC
jgi:hypothetical protein